MAAEMANSPRRKKTSRSRKPANPEEDDVPNIIEEPLRVIPVKKTAASKRKKTRRQSTR